MPFQSKAQQKWMFTAESRGEVPKGTAERWAKHTPDIKGLPARVKKHKTMKSDHPIHKHTSAHDMMSVEAMHKDHAHKMHPAHKAHPMHKHFVAGISGVRHVMGSGAVEHKTMAC